MSPTNETETVAPVGAEHSTLYVAIEISRKSWVVGVKSPASEKIGLHSLGPADKEGLKDLIENQRAKAERVAEDGWPFAEGQVCGDDDRGALVEPAHQTEEQLPAGLGEGQVAELVEDDEVAADELVCGAALAPGAEFGLEVVDQVDDVVAAASGTLADAGARDGDGEMGLNEAATRSLRRRP